jgi:septum formation protein
VLRLAVEKAEALAHPGELVLAADTTVVLDEEILGKPADREEACWMLRRIAGREHTVLSGIALYEPAAGRRTAAVDSTRVQMAPLTDEQIEWYVATGEPMDKAGSYGIQGYGATIVERIDGDYFAVMGLSLVRLVRLLARFGVVYEFGRLSAQRSAISDQDGPAVTDR